MQKNREDRAGFSSYGYELNPSFTKLLENLGKLVWLHGTVQQQFQLQWLRRIMGSTPGCIISNAATQLRKSGFRCVHLAQFKDTFSDRQFSEVKSAGNMLCAKAAISEAIEYYF